MSTRQTSPQNKSLDIIPFKKHTKDMSAHSSLNERAQPSELKTAKGFVIILVVLGVVVIAVAGAAVAAVVGQAPKCPSQGGAARSEREIGDLLDKSGTVTVADSEATTIAQKYVKGKVQDARVCFTAGLGHASGSITLGPVSPTFYASAGVDLSGTTPKTTNLNVKVGALPNMPFLSDQVGKIVADLINENLDNIQLKEKYSAQFSAGSVTVTAP